MLSPNKGKKQTIASPITFETTVLQNIPMRNNRGHITIHSCFTSNSRRTRFKNLSSSRLHKWWLLWRWNFM